MVSAATGRLGDQEKSRRKGQRISRDIARHSRRIGVSFSDWNRFWLQSLIPLEGAIGLAVGGTPATTARLPHV